MLVKARRKREGVLSLVIGDLRMVSDLHMLLWSYQGRQGVASAAENRTL